MPAIIRKIVLTGGPCAGKTTGLSWIRNAFSQRGWTVLIVPETATELISGGVAPWTCGTNLDYQLGQVRLQLTKEDISELQGVLAAALHMERGTSKAETGAEHLAAQEYREKKAGENARTT